MMVEDVSLDDSPLRDAPVLVARVRCGKGALRCSRCGRKAPGYDNGGGGRSWRHQDFGCFRVELSGPVPRVECRLHGVVVSRVPWAEPGGRFTRDFGSGCAWLMTVAGQKTVSGFPHIAWRTAGDGAGRIDSSVAEHRPNAERVLDSFHIVSWMTDALDRVGKRLWNQARRDGNTTAAGAMRGVEYAVPGNPGDLTERQSTALATLADADPKGQLPLVAAQGTPAPARRTGRSGTQTMDRPGVPPPHPRDRRTMREDPQTPRRHPHNHQARPFQRQDRSVQQQDQGHHPHGPRLPRHGQPHRHDQTQIRRTTHPPANTHPLTHKNSRSLLFIRSESWPSR